MLPKSCREGLHFCRHPRAPRRFLTPADAPRYEWWGQPSVAYGAIRALAYEVRRTETEYVRALYGDAGRQGDPWGGLRVEVCGLRVHFGAGLVRFPELIGPDRVLKPEGYELMARGELTGIMDFDQTDWRWVQDEIDITLHLPTLFCRELLAIYESYRTGTRPLPKFQSHSTAAALGYPIKEGTRNCTSIHAQHLEPWLEWAHMPLVFCDQVLARGPENGTYRTSTDCVLNQFLAWSEADLLGLLGQLAPDADWNAVAKGLVPVPTLALFS